MNLYTGRLRCLGASVTDVDDVDGPHRERSAATLSQQLSIPTRSRSSSCVHVKTEVVLNSDIPSIASTGWGLTGTSCLELRRRSQLQGAESEITARRCIRFSAAPWVEFLDADPINGKLISHLTCSWYNGVWFTPRRPWNPRRIWRCALVWLWSLWAWRGADGCTSCGSAMVWAMRLATRTWFLRPCVTDCGRSRWQGTMWSDTTISDFCDRATPQATDNAGTHEEILAGFSHGLRERNHPHGRTNNTCGDGRKKV